jgi:prephenate dehydrogenase
MTTKQTTRIAIIGLGLIGGSLAKALKKSNAPFTVSGYSRSNDTIIKAQKLGVIKDGSTELSTVVKNSDIVILCTPLSTYAAIVQEILPHLKNTTIITDVGSAKQSVIDTIVPLLGNEKRSLFVPAHPIAGTEDSGFSASKTNLFRGKKVCITPSLGTSRPAIKAITELWRYAGGQCEEISPQRHDHLYAAISHAPQYLAFCYASRIMSLPNDIQDAIYSQSDNAFDRFGRICLSPHAMWEDVFEANKSALMHWLDKTMDSFSSALDHFEQHTQDFSRNYASLNVLEHSQITENLDKDVIVYRHVLPVLLSRALHSAAELHLPHAGSGFTDFTCMYQIALPPKEISLLKDNTLRIGREFKEWVEREKTVLIGA